ncbi:hypothetical protein [Macellibacteroides fermentans]|uniref:Uncharacterized protein n=1 Tax=Parabacteroides chartae TaxID=1037355 RepID=A0A1T5APX9_9BACT|nr:hypothetical protein [Parabacteroides chartae]SKB36919.1 hypothetical protein SAMN05660349_00799 [Parabacteroides chartae]
MKKGTVYICHHIDTEGPLWENIQELFNRLDIIFGLKLNPTYDNLEKLQKNEIHIPSNIKDSLLLAIDPHTIGFMRNWGMIEEMLNHIMSKKYRNELKDSFGGGWIFNWHIMDHVGFGSHNPRHRDYGYHNILDFYKYMIEMTESYEDAIHWHFHPIPFKKEANIPATSYDNCMPVLLDIITRRLIDRNIFPVVNRAGFHTERIDANLFLEQWIPFDPSNQSVDDINQPNNQKDLANGRYGDWRGAPSDWSLYHPDLYDWRKPGISNRWIARILNMKSRHRNISEEEIEKAFIKANKGENVYLGITNHDWRDMAVEIDEFRNMLKLVSKKYPAVKFKFSETVHAFQNVIGYSEEEINNNHVDISINLEDNILRVNVINGEIFGPQPYLAFKTKSGEYYHDNFDFQEFKKSFSYVFDEYTFNLALIEKIVVATNDKYGNTCIKCIDNLI